METSSIFIHIQSPLSCWHSIASISKKSQRSWHQQFWLGLASISIGQYCWCTRKVQNLHINLQMVQYGFVWQLRYDLTRDQYDNMIKRKHAKACASYMKIWNLLEDRAGNCSKLLKVGSDGSRVPLSSCRKEWLSASSSGTWRSKTSLCLHQQCIQNHGKSNLSLKAWQLKWLLNGYYVTTINSMINQRIQERYNIPR